MHLLRRVFAIQALQPGLSFVVQDLHGCLPGGQFDLWVQRFVEFVLAFPQLPLYLALTSLLPVTAPSNIFIAFVIGVMAMAMYEFFAVLERRMTGWAHRGAHANG